MPSGMKMPMPSSGCATFRKRSFPFRRRRRRGSRESQSAEEQLTVVHHHDAAHAPGWAYQQATHA